MLFWAARNYSSLVTISGGSVVGARCTVLVVEGGTAALSVDHDTLRHAHAHADKC